MDSPRISNELRSGNAVEMERMNGGAHYSRNGCRVRMNMLSLKNCTEGPPRFPNFAKLGKQIYPKNTCNIMTYIHESFTYDTHGFLLSARLFNLSEAAIRHIRGGQNRIMQTERRLRAIHMRVSTERDIHRCCSNDTRLLSTAGALEATIRKQVMR